MKQIVEWYEVLRHDGRKQYATKSRDYYYLWGSGFAIGEFDAISVTPINGHPPVKESETYVCFDNDLENVFKAIVNDNHRWNGWECPFIHSDDVIKLLKYLCVDEEYYKYEFDGDDILFMDVCDDTHVSRIEPTMKNGEKYYYFGNEGFTFEKARFPYQDL
jgi:hypothetical protein